MFVQVERKLWTVDELHLMAENGILQEDDRLELIEGEIITMSPVGVRHLACVNRLTDLFSFHFRGRAIVSVQNPIRLNDRSEPQPDIALLKFRPDFYGKKAPTGDDVLLLIEVADATVAYDRVVKQRIYAQANIGDYWLVNLVDNAVEVFRRPEDGVYTDAYIRYSGEQLAAKAFPETLFLVDDIIYSSTAGFAEN